MTTQQAEAQATPSPAGPPDAEAVKQWLVAYMADMLEFDHSEVNTRLPLGRYGLDSTAAVALTGDLGNWLGCEIDPRLLYEHKSIDALAEFITANYAKLRKPEK